MGGGFCERTYVYGPVCGSERLQAVMLLDLCPSVAAGDCKFGDHVAIGMKAIDATM